MYKCMATCHMATHRPLARPRARGARGVPAPPDPRVVSLQSRSLSPVVTLESAYTISRYAIAYAYAYATRYSSSQSFFTFYQSPWPLATGLARTVALSTQYSVLSRSALGARHSAFATRGLRHNTT